MAEWSIAPVLKTGVLRGTGGSNPSLSAKVSVTSCKTTSYADFSFKGAPNLRQNLSFGFYKAFFASITRLSLSFLIVFRAL